MSALDTSAASAATWKISDVVELTGVSKELIHHYLRQGLLPKPASRAAYDQVQVRLLRVIRVLREELHLPLDDIRALFEAFRFEPDRLEPLVLGQPRAERLVSFAQSRSLAWSPGLTAEQVAARADVAIERVADYVEAGVISPRAEGDEERFSAHDATALALCERGAASGIPFDSFRTVASYIRLAFELEHGDFFDLPESGADDVDDVLGLLFVRREIVGGFVQSVLMSLEEGHFVRAVEQRAPARPALDGVVFRPSQAFLRRHRVVEAIEKEKAALGRDPTDRRRWHRAAALLLHAGFYGEATFFLDQALGRWPDDPSLATQLGIAQVLAGDVAKGRTTLEQLVAAGEPSPVASISLALALWSDWPRGSLKAAGASARVADLVTSALANGEGRSARARMFGGWLLTALPRTFQRVDEGLSLLFATLEQLRGDRGLSRRLPGLRERYLANAAFLALESLERLGPQARQRGRRRGWPTPEQLRTELCRLDPASTFAASAFLTEDSRAGNGRRRRR